MSAELDRKDCKKIHKHNSLLDYRKNHFTLIPR
jgi:hypothetical protein